MSKVYNSIYWCQLSAECPLNGSLSYESILAQLTNFDGVFNVIVNAPLYGDLNGVSARAVGRDADGFAYLPDGNGGFLEVPGIGTVDGYGSTEHDYIDLAWETGGAAWDLNLLRAGGTTAQSFTGAFVQVKTEEIIPTPVPSSVLLMSVGLLGLARMARRVD